MSFISLYSSVLFWLVPFFFSSCRFCWGFAKSSLSLSLFLAKEGMDGMEGMGRTGVGGNGKDGMGMGMGNGNGREQL